MMTLSEAAQRLDLAPVTLRIQIAKGVLAARKIGPMWVVEEEEVARYEREHRRAKA